MSDVGADEPRYQYDMDAVEAAAREVAAEVEKSGGDKSKEPIKIDSQGDLLIGTSVFKNLSPAAKRARIQDLTDGIMGTVRNLINRANSHRNQPEEGDES